MIKDLILRLIDADKPSRELDLAIHLAIDPDGTIARVTKSRRGLDGCEGLAWDISTNPNHHGAVLFEKYDKDAAEGGRCYYNGGYPLPAYTASIDAALTLMRKHFMWQLKQGIGCQAIVWYIGNDQFEEGAPTGTSTTFPALALTIAALTCRAMEDRIL